MTSYEAVIERASDGGRQRMVPGTWPGVPPADIDRFVLTNSLADGDSGWNIYLTSGTTRVQSLVLGDHLVMITPSGAAVTRSTAVGYGHQKSTHPGCKVGQSKTRRLRAVLR